MTFFGNRKSYHLSTLLFFSLVFWQQYFWCFIGGWQAHFRVNPTFSFSLLQIICPLCSLLFFFSRFLQRLSVCSSISEWHCKRCGGGKEGKEWGVLRIYSFTVFWHISFSISISSWDQSDTEISIWIYSLPTSQCSEENFICMCISRKLEVKYFLRDFCFVIFW